MKEMEPDSHKTAKPEKESFVLLNKAATNEDVCHENVRQNISNDEKRPAMVTACSADSVSSHQAPILCVFLFACTGSVVVWMTREYSAGFYLDFLRANNLDENIGTACLSVLLLTSAISPYIFNYLPASVRNTSLLLRTLVLFLLNTIATATLACIDTVVSRDQSAAFVIIFMSRMFQGLISGLLIVTVQGELVDLYLQKYKKMMVIISSMIYVAVIASSIGGTELYIAGGWKFAALGMAATNLIPIALLPMLHKAQSLLSINTEQQTDQYKSDKIGESEDTIRRTDEKQHQKEVEQKEVGHEGVEQKEVDHEGVEQKLAKLTLLRKLAYYMPDIAMTVNSVAYITMFYALPARMVKYNIDSLSNAVLFLNIMLVVSLVVAFMLGFLADRRLDVIVVMAVGSVFFYIGIIIVYGSTTEFLSIPYGYQIGYAMAGLGDPTFLNLTIMSKFVLYENWKVDISGLGKRAAATYNVTFNVGSALGMVLSAQVLSRESEIPVLATMGALCGIVLVCYAVCKSVK